jgi:hypothetical protein
MLTERERSPLAAAGTLPARDLRPGYAAVRLNFSIFVSIRGFHLHG